ncbi:MAG: CcoQ/FixQ family Cbb3-type cytochrome c oxidase assembly chaperone [Bacteroidetes bacterium]|nr:CcoQ/FixQ family Cbb3-type cytochrome c oxidase assembly chaperone [Bacteroidota bacterium]
MLKFIKHHLDTIAGVEIFPVISFLIFFSVFLFAVIYVWKADKKHMDEMSSLPLDK